jgi:hypothetical protein
VLDGRLEESRSGLMARVGQVGLLLGAAAVLVSCFDFEVPVDPTPLVAVDPALVGTWRCLPADPGPTDGAATFVVSKVGERAYAIAFDDGDGDPETYEAYPSHVKGRALLNVRNPKPGTFSKRWAVARYALLLPTVLHVQLASDELLRDVGSSPSALRQALERFDSRPELYLEYCVCVRATAKPSTSGQ